MENNKLICPVKRLENTTSSNKPTVGLNIDFKDDDLNVRVDISAKSVIKSIADFISKKFKN